jgi:hypothetical protein
MTATAAMATAEIAEAPEGREDIAAILSSDSPLELVKTGLDNGLSANSKEVGSHMLREAKSRVEADAIANTNAPLTDEAMANYIASQRSTGQGTSVTR